MNPCKIATASLVALLIFALSNASVLSWGEYLRLFLIVAAMLLLYTPRWCDKALQSSSQILALIFMFVITQFDPASSVLNDFTPQPPYNAFFIASSILVCVVFASFAIESGSLAAVRPLSFTDGLVLALAVVLPLIALAAKPAFDVPLGSSQDFRMVARVSAYAMLWFALTRLFRGRSDDYQLRQMARLRTGFLLFAAVVCAVGLFRVGAGFYWTKMGDKALAAGAVDDALQVYQKALVINESLDLDQMGLLQSIAITYIRKGQIEGTDRDQFLSVLDQIRSREVAPKSAHRRIGDIFYEAKQVASAAVEYEAYLGLLLGQRDEPVLNRLGDTYVQLGPRKYGRRLQSLAERYRYVPNTKPDNYESALTLGKLHAQIGAFRSAIPNLEVARRLEPGEAEAHYFLGCSFLQQGSLREAKESFRQALALRPEFADAHFQAGQCYQQAGELRLALEAFEKTVELLPTHLDGWLALDALEGSRLGEVAISEAIAGLTPENRVNRNLGPETILIGYDLPSSSVTPGGTLRLTLYFSLSRTAIVTPVNGHFFMRFRESPSVLHSPINTGPTFESPEWNLGEVRKVDYEFRIPSGKDFAFNCDYYLQINVLFVAPEGRPHWDWSSSYAITSLCLEPG